MLKIPNEVPGNKEVEVLIEVKESNVNKVVQKEEHLSKSGD